MKEKTFANCPFKLTLPKITVLGQSILINFQVSFAGKTDPIKYVISECCLTDFSNKSIHAQISGQSNFCAKNNFSVAHGFAVESQGITTHYFTLQITLLTQDGERIDTSYRYIQNAPVTFNHVSRSSMNEPEKDFFQEELQKALNGCTPPLPPTPPSPTPPSPAPPVSLILDRYVEALSSELRFLKNNGGKKYKATDGRLLTPDSKEFCYSFELETELYLSDDAPVTVLHGLEKTSGTVIVCDGFQIIVSLARNIGETVPSAHINVEPWKLAEKLRDTIKSITPNDTLAWQLIHTGPSLAEKKQNLSVIKRGQNAAISHALDNPFTVIWGPPGTGKTYTMAHMAKTFVDAGKSVLIVSHSNISVDNVVKQIAKQFSAAGMDQLLEQGKVLRYGFVRDEELSKIDNCVAFNYVLKQHPELCKQYQELSEMSRKLRTELQFNHNAALANKLKDVEKLLSAKRATLKAETQACTAKAQVVATTVSKLYMDMLFNQKKYNVVMFDEVSMAYVPQLACAATYAQEKLICVGDFRQLSPIVLAKSAKETLEPDIFSFLNINRNGAIYNHPWLVMLNEQRRMHPHISRFSNAQIYKGLLKDHESVLTKWNHVVEKEPLSKHAMNLIDLSGTFCAASKNADNSHFNILSALFSFATALKAERAQDQLAFKEEEKVGIITPYAAQTRLIRAMIQDYREKAPTAVSCATVHQFQGSERNVVVFDAVESYPFNKPGWLVSKAPDAVLRLINVALTRARCKFITIANTHFWNNKLHDSYNTYYQLLGHIKKNDHTVNLKNDALLHYAQELDFGNNIQLYQSSNVAWEPLFKDLQSATKKIRITLPNDKLNPQIAEQLFDIIDTRSRHGVSVLGKARSVAALSSDWKMYVSKSKDAVFPLISIDDRITWYGIPVTKLLFEDKTTVFPSIDGLIFRISGKHTNSIIYSLCNLDHRIDENGASYRLSEGANTATGGGLAQFIHDTEHCTKCGSAMKLYVSKSGKRMMKCSSCGTPAFLTVDIIHKYLTYSHTKCPVCGKDPYAGVGKFGLYVKCGNGHFTKLSEL